MDIKIISLEDDLEQLVADINGSSWDEANDLPEFQVSALQAYLKRQDTIFIACRQSSAQGSTLLGIASSRIEIKAYSEELWLYVDEVDVCADQRQKGAGKLIMQKLIEIAEEHDCEELWLGTEVDNHPANALYRSLDPDDVSTFIGYTYEMED